MNTPVLYSFRRCPYCMRAHMALKKSGIQVELREVKLSDMPKEALEISPKATVPILVLSDGSFIDESWDIVKWALEQNDPDKWLGEEKEFLLETEMLVETNDFSFKEDLDHYKYADRHPEQSELEYRQACEEFIEELEEMLTDNRYLLSDQLTAADISVFSFVRQFSMVDKDWFDQAPYPRVQHWLEEIVSSKFFQSVFQKHELWQTGDTAVYL